MIAHERRRRIFLRRRCALAYFAESDLDQTVALDDIDILALEAVIRTVGDMRLERKGLSDLPKRQPVSLFQIDAVCLIDLDGVAEISLEVQIAEAQLLNLRTEHLENRLIVISGSQCSTI